MAGENALQRVSLNLAELLRDRMQRIDVSFSFGPPGASANQKGPRLNLFLYQVNENPAFRNEEDPRRAIPGHYGSPPLALELGYLFTSYGTPTSLPTPTGFPAIQPESLSELDAQFILADAMRVLHDVPIITRKTQRERVPGGSLLDPELEFEFESLRVSPRGLNLDDLTKLWTAFKEDFQRSVAYGVSIIRVERRRPQAVGPPVLVRGINVQPTTVLGPELDLLEPDVAAAGESITISGRPLDDPSLDVLVSDTTQTGFPATPQALAVVRDSSGVHFSLPNNPTLYLPGPKSVQLRIVPTPGHPLVSNTLTVKLLPRVSALSTNTGPFDGSVTVTISGNLLGQPPAANAPSNPLVPTVLFGSYVIPDADVTFTGLPNSLDVKLSTPDPNDPNAPKPGQVVPVRVRVNGVENRTWHMNPVTQRLEMDPGILFTVT